MSPPFPRILCAVDGSEGANVALELAGDDARVTLVSVWSDAAGELANLQALLGHDIRYITDFGGAAARIVAAAEAERAGLVVVGSGAKHGAAALASTSERVAHHAPCSVLIHRHR